MLTIKDSSGVNLVDSPPDEVEYRAVGIAQTVQVSIECSVIEDNALLPGKFVNGTLDWNDGSLPTVYDAVAGTLSIDTAKGLTNGVYVISVEGRNYKSPEPDVVRVNFPVTVVQERVTTPPPRLIYGPILPRDSGFPNPDQWDFNTESDLLVLESSVRMLLLTSKGERLMEPEYGTNIRRILFEQNVAGIESAISDEITTALNTWERRLQLQTISVTRNNDSSVTVNASFLTRQSSPAFSVNLEFVR